MSIHRHLIKKFILLRSFTRLFNTLNSVWPSDSYNKWLKAALQSISGNRLESSRWFGLAMTLNQIMNSDVFSFRIEDKRAQLNFEALIETAADILIFLEKIRLDATSESSA